MTIPEPPLPSLSDLVRAMAAPPTTAPEIVTVPGGYSTWFYRRGSIAMAAAVTAVQRRVNTDRVVVGLPDYFCNDALLLIRHSGADLIFYPINADLTVDWTAAERLFSRQVQSVFVLVHYFGFPNQTAQAREFCDGRSIVLLEDAAHCLGLSTSMGLGDFIIFSPRKLLPSPSGGVLAATSDWMKYVSAPSRPNAGSAARQWAIRRSIQKTLCDIGIPWHFLSGYQNPPLTEAVNGNAGSENEGCDEYSLRLLSILNKDRAVVVMRRRANYAKLAAFAGKARRADLLFDFPASDVCPYVLPVRVEGDTAEIVLNFRRNGIPASRWPDLPPEVLQNPSAHDIALRTFGNVILLPIHQTLNDRDIEKIGTHLCGL